MMLFTKMEGCGNDYIYVNGFVEKLPRDLSRLAVVLSNRHFGIGADGFIIIMPSQTADARMVMYNADGSEAEMCGNGIRCVAKYVYDHGIKQAPLLRIETAAGLKEVAVLLENGKVENARVNMGLPQLGPVDIPVNSKAERVVNTILKIDDTSLEFTAVGMGNPHCIIYVDNVQTFPVTVFGPKIETHPFFPKRTNVEFVQVLSRNEVRQRTWERGSGETLACGTGASAVCVAGVLTGRTDPHLTNRLSGGTLLLEWPDVHAPVFMTGPCVEVFQGEWHGV